MIIIGIDDFLLVHVIKREYRFLISCKYSHKFSFTDIDLGKIDHYELNMTQGKASISMEQNFEK